MKGELGYPYLEATKLTEQIDSVNSFSQLSRADKISCLVAQTLNFVQYDQPRAKLLTPNNMAGERHEFNCYGYSIVTAEALSLAGINNYILYANRHALNLAVDSQTGERLLISSDDTRFNSLATDDILRFDNALPDNDGNFHMAAILHTDQLVKQNQQINHGNIDACRPWLDNNRRRMGQLLDYNDQYIAGSGRYDRGHSLAATVTSSALGRVALEALYNFEYDMYRGESHQTANNFAVIRDHWPEIGRDNLRDGNYSLNRYLRDGVANNRTREAVSDAAAVSQGVSDLTKDLSVCLWLPDFIRKTGTMQRDWKLLQRAHLLYDDVLRSDGLSDRGRQLVIGKINKTERIMESIRSDD